MHVRAIAILGATGSIGTTTLSVVRAHPSRLRIAGLAAHSRWRAVAETSDLASVVGPRVRFLCLDADETHVVLGANTGSLYVFARRRASADATTRAAHWGIV